jgi:hypothetical protein
MTRIEALVEGMPDAHQAMFWSALQQAISWRGWDRAGNALHRPCGCHACEFIRKVDELAAANGTEFEEYT